MKEYEYEEENLDDFMVNAANILSEEDNIERNSIIESLKQHLSSIFHIQNEMENFFRTLNGVIFTSKDKKSKKNSQKIDNREPFILYPLIFSFNPRTTSYFLDYYLGTLQQSICEENRPDFSFLSDNFAKIINAFFSDVNHNKNLIKKNFLLEQNKKKNIYEKIFNFCNSNIKTNKPVEQSFGCLLLTEFIENCPLVKEDKNLDCIFKTMSDYLDDRWFECKIDLLNCTISLIFSAETKFKPYATICLFRVLDYLTDMDWMKRKLAINIIYTLVYYCRDEIIAVKENVLDFLYSLKKDPIDEIREVNMHTLKYLGEEDEDIDGEEYENDPANINNENNKPKNIFNKNKNSNQRNKINKSFEDNNNADSQTIKSARSNKAPIIKRNTNKNENLKLKLQKQQNALQKMEKDFIEKKKNFDTIDNNINNYNTINSNISSSKSKKNNIVNPLNQTLNDESSKFKSKQNLTKIVPFENAAPDSITSTINSILEQIKKIQEDQEEFRQILINIKQTAGNNYLNLNERLRALEKNSSKYKRNLYGPNYYYVQEYHGPRSQRDFRDNKKITRNYMLLNRNEEKEKIEELKEKFKNGRYNETLLETNQNDRYLIKLLPLMDKKIIPKIEIALLEDTISRLNKRVPILCMEEGRESINDVLLFYIQLLKSKIELKLITQLSINNALNFLKVKGNNKLNEEDKNNIEKITGSLRI